MTRQFLFKVKEGRLAQWKDWCLELANEYCEEAKQTLQHEHALCEKAVLFEIDGNHYVYGSTEYFDTPRKADEGVKLNQLHKKNVTECLELLGAGTELFNICTQNGKETP